MDGNEGFEYYKSHAATMADIRSRLESDDVDVQEAAQEEESYFALGVGSTLKFDITLSFGGPNAWLEVEYDKQSKEVCGVTYGYAWASRPYYRQLDEDDPLFKYAESVAEYTVGY